MPVLKFETKLINGRPNIVFETERQKKSSKKRDYKTKVQKFSLRNIANEQSKEDGTEVEVEDVDNGNIGRHNKVSEKIKQRDYKPRKRSQSSSISQNGDSDLYDISNKRVVANPSDKKKSVIKKESLFNFLKNETKEAVNESNNLERKSKINDQRRIPHKKSLSDEDIDDIMKQVVLENKEVLTDDQLVDLLAKIYIEAKGGSRNDESVSVNNKVDTKKINDKPEKLSFIPSLDIEDSEKRTSHAVPSIVANQTLPQTMAQKKQMQWDKERLELEKITSYNPWGRPGCGAPIKDPYEGRTSDVPQSRTALAHVHTNDDKRVRSARTPEPSGLSQAEIKRRQWLMELNEQVAEKEKIKFQSEPYPSSISDQYNNRSSMYAVGDLSPGHGRGKGLANLNQVTSEELMLKRHKQMEQQEAIKRQIEEKELIKRLDRDKKALLDQQEEMRINKEKQYLDSQFLCETARVKQKEDESGRRFAQLRTQVEEAEKAALLDKRLKRLQRLELAGHDTRQLRAGLASDQMSGRLDASTEFLSEENSFNKIRHGKDPKSKGYNFTPRLQYTLTEDHGIQTDIEENYRRDTNLDFDKHRSRNMHRNRSVDSAKEGKSSRQVSGNRGVNKIVLKNHDKRRFKVPSATYTKQEEKAKSKRPESIGSRKPWGVKKVYKKYVPQSKRDPFYSVTKDERENNKNDRVNQILAQVRANLDRIPDKDVSDGNWSQRHKKCDDRRQHDHNKENIEINHGTYDLKNGDQFQLEEDGDRVQASVRYKDSYRQSTKPKPHRATPNNSDRNVWTPNNNMNMWDETNHEIVRTMDVLDPSIADQKCLISRENTCRERARNSYYKSQNPGQLGDHLDKQYNSSKPYQVGHEKRDPLSYPPGHPTNRQNTIMKQLSDIREDLRMRQKEIETSLSLNDDL